jgi:hypothetical protein
MSCRRSHRRCPVVSTAGYCSHHRDAYIGAGRGKGPGRWFGDLAAVADRPSSCPVRGVGPLGSPVGDISKPQHHRKHHPTVPLVTVHVASTSVLVTVTVIRRNQCPNAAVSCINPISSDPVAGVFGFGPKKTTTNNGTSPRRRKRLRHCNAGHGS